MRMVENSRASHFSNVPPPPPRAQIYEPRASDSEGDTARAEDVEKHSPDCAPYFLAILGAFFLTQTMGENGLLKRRPTDYKIGRANGYAQIRSRFSKYPSGRKAEARLFLGEIGILYIKDGARNTGG